MTLKQKIIATILSVLLIGIAFYLVFVKYADTSLQQFENDYTNEKQQNHVILTTIPTTLERYKILNIVYEHEHIYAILHCDNGNLCVLPIAEAFIDPDLKNVNEGFLYREAGQIYIRAK